jgi:hypothetical protein
MADETIKTDDEVIAAGGFTAEQIAAIAAIVKNTLLMADGGSSVVTVEPVPFGEMRESTPVLSATQVTQAINNETVRAVAKETEVQTRVETVAVEAAAATEAAKTEVLTTVEERIVQVETRVEEADATKCSAHRYKGTIDLGAGDEINTEEASLKYLQDNIVEPKNGDVYVNKYNGMIFCWTEFNGNDATWVPKWVRLPSIIDLTNYYTKADVYNKNEVDLVRNLAQSGVDGATAASVKAVSVETALNAVKQALAGAESLVELAEETNTFGLRTRINEIVAVLKAANLIMKA